MKSEPLPRLGIVDALSAGLTQTRRRPWLMLIPAAVDLWLWLAPRITIEPLLQRFLQLWEQLLQTAYTPEQLASMDTLLRAMREASSQVGGLLNLAEGITGGWLGAPSLLATSQVTRMTFISDLVLAPAGLSLEFPRLATAPWQRNPIGIDSVGTLALVMLGTWLVGQVILALYMRAAGGAMYRALPAGEPGGEASNEKAPSPASAWRGVRGLGALALRLAAFSIVLGVAILLLRLPLAFAVTLLMMSSNSAVGLLSLLFGGIALWLTMWFLLAMFFVNEGILLERRPLGRSLAESIGLVHRNFSATFGLAALINLLLYGFRVVWGLVAQSPAGVVIAIVGNAYLVTSMLLATFAFYESMRRATVAQRAKMAN